jgi:hypothetical protein
LSSTATANASFAAALVGLRSLQLVLYLAY